MEYLIDYEDDNNENINIYDDDNKRSATTKPINFRYPGDIKSTTKLSNSSLKVAVGVLENTIKTKSETIRTLHEVNRGLNLKIETLESKLLIVHQVLDGMVTKKYLGAETVQMIKVKM